MTPATAFTKAVCERASKDGWLLRLSTTGYSWRGSTGGIEGANIAPLQHQLWQACCDLQHHEYPDLKVTID